MEKESKIIVGFKTVVLGLCLYIIELLSLPVFGILQKCRQTAMGFTVIFGSTQEYSLTP
ncbi:hypothetical protein [Allobaculum sp. Allo2]|uniref:hypothetical protein n=1 Tax=Allobaculum sp. Allo2 TaxID=2853432 RepID=UPI001F603504|nr:hypothetical protein [Allobaculum sp. Allo2]UNT93254.1 hypothetical protein KWG61_14970 [Allobaculum sp. Allo2]